MAQHDYDIANGTGFDVRTDLNNLFSAVATNNSGSSAPSPTFAHQWWFDTANSLMKQRDAANTAWVTVAVKDGSGWRPYYNGVELDTFTDALKGLVPASGGGTTNFLRADGTFADPGSGLWTRSATRTLPAAAADTFTGLPAGLTVIGIIINDVSLDGAVALALRLGDSGGVESSGYSSTAINLEDALTRDDGLQFVISQSADAASIYSGTLWLTRADATAHLWSLTGKLWENTSDLLQDCAGIKTLSADLSQVQLQSVAGAANFDSGYWQLIYA